MLRTFFFVILLAWLFRNEILYQKKCKLDDQNKECQIRFSRYDGIDPLNECGERLNAYHNIDKDDIVLEIGGNIGSTSLIISDKLRDSSNLMVVEPSKMAVRRLLKNRGHRSFQIFNGAIGKKQLYGIEVGDMGYMKFGTGDKIRMISFDNLQARVGIFNTLVIDCEGCYTSLLGNEIPLDSIKKILIEWDGEFAESLLLSHGFVKTDQYAHPDLTHGISTYRRD